MRIRMLRDQEGSHNGVDLRTYLAGKEYLLQGPHPEMLGRNFVGMGAAEALSEVPPAPAPPDPPPPPPPAPEAPPDPERQPLGPEVTKPAPGPEERAALAESEAFVAITARIYGVQFDPATIMAHKPGDPPPLPLRHDDDDEDDGPDAPPADDHALLPASDGSLLPVGGEPASDGADSASAQGDQVDAQAAEPPAEPPAEETPPAAQEGEAPPAEGSPADAATPEAPAKPAKASKGSRAPAVEP